jgi:hypothetical protein
MPTTILVPDTISIPSNQSEVDATMTISPGDTTSLSIGGDFTISIKSKSGLNPQTVTFGLAVNSGTTRPGTTTVTIGAATTAGGGTSPPIDVSF